MKNARVVLVMPDYPDDSPFLLALFTGLADRGIDVRIFCAGGDSSRIPPDLPKRFRDRIHVASVARHGVFGLARGILSVLRLFAANPAGFLRFLRVGRNAFPGRVLKRLILDSDLVMLRPTILHFQFGTLARGRMHLGEVCGCAVITSFRGYDLNFVGLDFPDFYSEVWSKGSGFHFLGEDLKRRAAARGFRDDKPVVLIPPAIDLKKFDPGSRTIRANVGSAERPLRILSVGRLVWKKGYEFGLQAVAQLKESGCVCEYRIIGDGDYFEAIAFARHDLGLDSEATLCGQVTPAAVRDAMMWADVLLHPAVSEGFCNAVVEAQAMKLPVVCTDADGLPENVEHGVTGFVVPRRDSAAMSARLMELARNASLRETMGNAGRERVVTKFRVEDQVSAFSAFYARFAG